MADGPKDYGKAIVLVSVRKMGWTFSCPVQYLFERARPFPEKLVGHILLQNEWGTFLFSFVFYLVRESVLTIFYFYTFDNDPNCFGTSSFTELLCLC